jgi:hypothetical protein
MCFGLRMKEAGKEKLQYFKSQRDVRGKNQLSQSKTSIWKFYSKNSNCGMILTGGDIWQ